MVISLSLSQSMRFSCYFLTHFGEEGCGESLGECFSADQGTLTAVLKTPVQLEQEIKFPFYDVHLYILSSTKVLCKFRWYVKYFIRCF